MSVQLRSICVAVTASTCWSVGLGGASGMVTLAGLELPESPAAL